jgi:hypothetical protein
MSRIDSSLQEQSWSDEAHMIGGVMGWELGIRKGGVYVYERSECCKRLDWDLRRDVGGEDMILWAKAKRLGRQDIRLRGAKVGSRATSSSLLIKAVP